MSELMEVFEPGDKFATIDRQGRVLIWRVDEQGLVKLQPGYDRLPDPGRFPDPGQTERGRS